MSMIWIMKETYIRDTLCNGGIIDGKKNTTLYGKFSCNLFYHSVSVDSGCRRRGNVWNKFKSAVYGRFKYTGSRISKKRFTAVGARFLYQNYDVYCCCGIHIWFGKYKNNGRQLCISYASGNRQFSVRNSARGTVNRITAVTLYDDTIRQRCSTCFGGIHRQWRY